jgi:hypothetical protein
MPYVLAPSRSPSFALDGLSGYEFTPLRHQDIAAHFIDVIKGHDTFIISKALTRMYYIIDGAGVFTINNQKYDVTSGLLVEIPPGVEYSYSGSMKIFLVSYPRWFAGNEQTTRKNPDVVSEAGIIARICDKFRRYRGNNRENPRRSGFNPTSRKSVPPMPARAGMAS